MYRYQDNAEWLATSEGIRATGEALANVENILKPAGCAFMCAIWPRQCARGTDNMMAAGDRLVEMTVLAEVPQPAGTAGQFRIFRLLRDRRG